MSRKFDDFLQEQLQDSEIRKEYEALQPEHTVIQAMIDARKKSGMTQKELAEITGIAQGDISKLERGSANPSIRTLQRLAKGMGMILKIEFTPEQVSVVKKFSDHGKDRNFLGIDSLNVARNFCLYFYYQLLSIVYQ